MFDKTAGQWSLLGCGLDRKKFLKQAWDAYENRKNTFDECLEKKSFKTCEAYGFFSVYTNPERDKNIIEKASHGFLPTIYMASSETYPVYHTSGIPFISQIPFMSEMPFVGSEIYTLDDMKNHLHKLSKGEKLSKGVKRELDEFLDFCAKKGCGIYAMEDQSEGIQKPNTVKSNIAQTNSSKPNFS